MKRLAILFAVLALVAAACGGSDDDGPSTETTAGSGGGSGNVAAGETFYQGTCAACHGPDANGIDGLGKDLHNNQFIQSNTDDQMVAFLKVGRPAGDPANTTGVDMPPRGGNPSLSDTDLLDIVAFLDTLQ